MENKKDLKKLSDEVTAGLSKTRHDQNTLSSALSGISDIREIDKIREQIKSIGDK